MAVPTPSLDISHEEEEQVLPVGRRAGAGAGATQHGRMRLLDRLHTSTQKKHHYKMAEAE